MQRLCTASSLVEAHLLVHGLEQAGIEVRVFNEYAQGAAGEIPFQHACPEIWLVHDADRARAEAVLADRRAAAAGADRRCEACGEANPASFELCWRCGAALGQTRAPG